MILEDCVICGKKDGYEVCEDCKKLTNLEMIKIVGDRTNILRKEMIQTYKNNAVPELW